MKSPLAITHCALLTPLDGRHAPSGEHLDTWRAIRAGMRVNAARGAVAEEFLAGDAEWDRSIRLAAAVARNVLPDTNTDNRTALFCGTSKGPATTIVGALASLQQGQALSETTARLITLGPAAMGTILGDILNIARVHTSVAACASGIFALHQAAQAIWRGEIDRAVIVAADASLHPLFEASFTRLGVLSPLESDGTRRCEPFSEQGRGFFLSEAAAAIVIERSTPSLKPLAFLESTWLGGDGTHLIAADPRAASLRRGLQQCATDAPAFIHAHAPGTSHDAHELAAIRAIAGNAPHVFSSKAYLGHTLGAAGLVSVALSALCHHHGQTLTGNPIPSQSASLTIAQGFGGHIAIARLRGI